MIAAFAAQYIHQQMPTDALPPRNTLPVIDQLAGELTIHVARYHDDHGTFPTAKNFWQALGIDPIYNPMNGSATIAEMRIDLDATNVGWVYDEADGVVYPGFLFNRGQPLTRPTTQPASSDAQ